MIYPIGSAAPLWRLDQLARIDPQRLSKPAQDANACGNVRPFD